MSRPGESTSRNGSAHRRIDADAERCQECTLLVDVTRSQEESAALVAAAEPVTRLTCRLDASVPGAIDLTFGAQTRSGRACEHETVDTVVEVAVSTSDVAPSIGDHDGATCRDGRILRELRGTRRHNQRQAEAGERGEDSYCTFHSSCLYRTREWKLETPRACRRCRSTLDRPKGPNRRTTGGNVDLLPACRKRRRRFCATGRFTT